MPAQVLMLTRAFSRRLISLVAHWVRVGYCQGNFNSDNCAAGGFTLDYGPFGFCEAFHPYYQPWTGGGKHFSFLNQPVAAEKNFNSFCSAVKPLLEHHLEAMVQLEQVQKAFPAAMQKELHQMWAAKLGLEELDVDLFMELMSLMVQTPVDYTIFFRELSRIPEDIAPLTRSFYRTGNGFGEVNGEALLSRWSAWLAAWRSKLGFDKENSAEARARLQAKRSAAMNRVNPKFTMREWLVAPAYQQAAQGDYQAIRVLQKVLTQPYAEQSEAIESHYNQLKPQSLFNVGGLSHYSCSS